MKSVWKPNLIQGTHEWVCWRDEGVGGSDFPCLTGSSPFSNEFKLLGDKTGHITKKPFKPLMDRGHMEEERARGFMNAQTGLIFRPACVELSGTPCRSSLDGFAIQDHVATVLECKYTSSEKLGEMILSDSPKQHYVEQLRYNMMCASATSGYIVVTDGDAFWYKRIGSNSEAWESNARKLVNEFWAKVTAIRNGTEQFFFPEVVEQSRDYHVAVQQMQEAKENADRLRAEIIRIADGAGKDELMNDHITAKKDKKGVWRLRLRD